MQGLEGVRVLELGHMVSAAYAAKLMADLSAEVIKIEEPLGDVARQRGPFPSGTPHSEKSGLYLALNTNKRSVLIGCLAVEADELWSFVQKKANPHWIWIAMEKQTRQIIAFHVDDRSRDSAKQLWAKIPAVYREQTTFYTDHYVTYTSVIPTAQHKPIAQLARNTKHIERFNNTLRQRVSRLLRSTLRLLQNVENHIGAIRYFIYYYNVSRTALLV